MKKLKQWMHSEGKTILWSLKQTCTIKKLPLFLWLALFLAISLSPTLSLLFSQRMIDNITAAIRDPSVKLQIGNIIIWGLFLTLSAGLSNLCALVFSTYLSNTYSIYMQERLMEQFNRIPLRQFANADFMNKTAGAVAGADRLSYFVDKSVALMTTLINIVFSYVVLVRTNIGIAGIALVIGIFVCSLSFRDVNDDGKVLQTQRVSPEKYRSKWNYGMQQGNLFRRSLYVESGIKTVDSVFLDTIKTFAFNRFARQIGFVEPICYNYLVHTDSTSRNKELHHGMWEVPRKTFGVMLNEMFATYTALTEEEDRLRAEQQMTKSYYSYMLQFLRKAPFREMKESYRKLHAMMREKFPRYLKNPYLTLRKKYGNRSVCRAAYLTDRELMRLDIKEDHVIHPENFMNGKGKPR